MAPSASKRGARKAAAAVRGGDKKKARRVEAAPATSADVVRARFPPCIRFDDPFDGGVGVPLDTPADWNDSADRAAERTSHAYRLLGTARLTVCLSPSTAARRASGTESGPESTAAVLDALARPVRASNRSVRRNYKGPGGVETWDDEGEPGNRGHLLPVNRLYERVNAGELVVSEPHGPQLIASLAASQHPITSPWGVPLTRCVCVNAPEPSDDLAEADSGAVTLTLACYAGRLMFELIACDEIKFVVSHLAPSAPVRHLATPPASHPRAFYVDANAAGGADDARFCFTLPGLLAAAVSEGYPPAPQPPGLALQMLDFQRQTLAWMRNQEAAPRGLNGAFWEERRWADADEVETRGGDGSYWYFPLAGELRLQEPPTSRGGMLCEEMGLGKTLEIIALVSADAEEAAAAAVAAAEANKPRVKEEKSSAAAAVALDEGTLEDEVRDDASASASDWDGASASGSSRRKIPSRATLIVVPPPLLRQWEAEVRKCARPGTLRVTVHQGRAKGPRGATDEERAAALAESDVVLCTYPQLQREATKAKSTAAGTAGGSGARRADAKILSRVRWRRVVLDECQMVRSSTTQLAAACRHLSADFRWMVSGTPLHAGVDDLNGELAFLGVWPFCLSDQTDGFWAHRIARPWAARDEDALLLLHALLRGVTVRHTKAQRRVSDDTPLLTLPPAGREWRPVAHGPGVDEAPSERFVCGFLEHHAAAAARGALATLHEAYLAGGGDGRNANANANANGAQVAAARQLAQRLLRLVRGATTSATLVRGRLRDVDQALRAAATRGGGGDGGARAPIRGVDGHLNMSAAEAAAASDFGRVRALPAARALVELMAPREANRTGPTAVAAVAGGSSAVMTAFQLRNADMHSFEADRQAWRGTNREYADAGGADLAHKLASVVDGVFRVLRAAAERHPRRDGVTSGVAAAVAAADAARVKARRRDAYARLHALKHAFPGPLADLCTCAWTPCECASTPRRDADAACCDAFAAHRELRRVDNLAGRIREATAAAASADAIANEEITAARAPLARLRWLLAVELITSGAAFELFPGFFGGSGDAGAPGRDPAAGPDDVAAARRGENLRARLSPRFLRRAFLSALLTARVDAAEREVDAARAAAQDRDFSTGKPSRPINRAPERLQEAYRDAVSRRREAAAIARDESPGGCRPEGGALLTAIPGADGLAASSVTRALRDAVDAHRRHAGRLSNEIGSLLPYLRALAAAGAEGAERVNSLDYGTVQQSGFELLNEVIAGGSPQCCICCAPAQAPCVTRCVHLACTRCVVTWFHAAPLHGAAASTGAAPCPLCRKPFTIDELIRLLPPSESEKGNDRGKGTGGGGGEGDEGGADAGDPDARRAPRFKAVASPADFSRLPLPRGENPADYRDGRYPALSMDGGRFLAHLHRAAMRRSPKMCALVTDLRDALSRPGAAGKVVVFSQLRDALTHAHQTLTWEGIRAEIVGARGGAGEDTEAAIGRFREDPDVKVLLLHAGSAAAGLTLTQADLVVLLEPFLSPGDEAQAASRVHRIGQTREVRCVTYYVEDTVEERLLAFRQRQNEFGGGDNDDAGEKADGLSVIHEGGADDIGAAVSRAQLQRMRFVFGIADTDAEEP